MESQYWWRKSKRQLLNIYSLALIRERYIELQTQYRSGSKEAIAQFGKWYQRVEKFALYYAQGGQGYLRDNDIDRLDEAQLTGPWSPIPIRSFKQVSDYAHKLNWIVFRGKHRGITENL